MIGACRLARPCALEAWKETSQKNDTAVVLDDDEETINEAWKEAIIVSFGNRVQRLWDDEGLTLTLDDH